MYKYLFCLCCLVSGIAVSAQTVDFTFTYYDIESTTNQGVAAVDILVENPKTKQNWKVATNEKGQANFKLPAGQNYQINIPLLEQQLTLKIAHLPAKSWSKMSVKDYSPAYFRQLEVEDSLYEVEMAEEEARWEKEQAENAKKPGDMLFYFINDKSDDLSFYSGDVFDGKSDGEKVGTNNYFWKGRTCTGSVNSKEDKITITKKPGTYSYHGKANTSDGIYQFEGTYTIVGNQVLKVPILLSACKKVK